MKHIVFIQFLLSLYYINNRFGLVNKHYYHSSSWNPPVSKLSSDSNKTFVLFIIFRN